MIAASSAQGPSEAQSYQMCRSLRKGARIKLPAKADPFVWLFSESTGRVLVSVKRGTERDLASLCRTNGVKLTRLGEVTDSEEATLEVVRIAPPSPLARIQQAWQSTLPAAMAH